MADTPSDKISSSPTPLSPRAQEYFDKIFKPKYDALQKAVEQTPLAILLWGPGPGDNLFYKELLRIRNELRQRGHAAFFSEELTSAAPPRMSQKGVEFLQAQAADLIIVFEQSYGSIAEVHDFASFRVVNYKMLIFVDEAAVDGYSYRGALSELKTLYNNVETYKYPEDIVQGNLLTKVLDKVRVLQMVKFRALESAISWQSLPDKGGAR